MRVSPAQPNLIYRVAIDMRDRDFAEISALSTSTDRAGLARYMSAAYGSHPEVIVVGDDAGWVAVGGLISLRPNVATLFMFANDRFSDIAFPLTKHIREVMFKEAERRGVHRFEAVSLATYKTSHRWMQHLGLSQEAYCRGYGKNGEDYIQLSKVLDAGSTGLGA